MKKRFLFIILTISFFLYGCNEKNIKDKKKAVSISWWHINSDEPTQKVFQQTALDFSEARNEIKIDVIPLNNTEFKSKLALKLAGGNPPDIFHSWGGGSMAELVEAGHLKDITEWYQSDQWESKINPAALEIYSYQERIYGFPHDMGAVGFWYNSQILKQVGFKDFPDDWDEFIELLDALKADGIPPISLGIADRWPVMYYWVYLSMRIGGPHIYNEIKDNKRLFTDTAIIQAGEMMRDLYTAEYFSESSLGDDFISQSRLIGDGVCSMQLMGQWALAIQAESADRKDELTPHMKFAPFPKIPGTPGKTGDAMGGGNGFVIGKNAPDEAIELLRNFSSLDIQQKYFDVFPAVPTVKGVRISAPEMQMVQKYVQNAENYSLYPDQLFPDEIGSYLNEISARVLLGEFTSEEGCQSMQKAWDTYQKKK